MVDQRAIILSIFNLAIQKMASKSKPAPQIIALTTDKLTFHYAELHDNHLLRGSSRALYMSNIKIIDVSAEWKAYLGGRVLEIEQAGSKWLTAALKPTYMKYMLQHVSGYVMPLLCVRSTELCEYFPKIAAAAPVAMPKQTVKAPGVVSASAAATAARSLYDSDDADSDAEAVCNGDDDPDTEWKKERDALSAAVARAVRGERRSAVKPKVSFK